MVSELFVREGRRRKKKKKKKEDEQNRNFRVCFSQLLYELGQLLGHFYNRMTKAFVYKFLSHFGLVFREFFPYLKYRYTL